MTEDDVPVLTEVVSDEFDSREALAREIERKASVTRIVREALAASLAAAGRKPE